MIHFLLDLNPEDHIDKKYYSLIFNFDYPHICIAKRLIIRYESYITILKISTPLFVTSIPFLFHL